MIRCTFCDHKNPPGTKRCAECGAELIDSTDSDSSEQESAAGGDRLGDLIRQGRTLEAIKVYREQTGAGLKEAKEAVEALASGNSVPPTSTSPEPANGLQHDVLVLLRAGQKIAAIKLYRDKTGSGLAEAKNAVEALARQNGLPEMARSGCGTSVLVLVGVVVAWAYLIFET